MRQKERMNFSVRYDSLVRYEFEGEDGAGGLGLPFDERATCDVLGAGRMLPVSRVTEQPIHPWDRP